MEEAVREAEVFPEAAASRAVEWAVAEAAAGRQKPGLHDIILWFNKEALWVPDSLGN